MGTTSSKPSSSSKSKHRSNQAPKGYYDYNLPMPQGYWPTAATHGYGYPPPVQHYAPVIPPQPISQYHSYHPPPFPQPAPVVPQRDHYDHPQPSSWPRPATRVPVPPITQPAVVPDMQPDTQPVTQPVIPPAPRREHRKKRKTTRRKMPTAIITFERPETDNHPAEATSATADLSRRLSNVAPSQQGNSHRPRTPVSSPSRSTHVKGASTHSSPQAQHPTNPVPPPSTTYERPHNPLPKVPDDIFATTPYKHLFKDLDLPPVSALAPGQSYIVEHNEEVPQVAKKGLFGLKKKQPSILRQTRYVYVGTPTSATSSNNPPPTAGMYSNPPPMSAASTNPPPTSAASTNPPPTSATNTNPFPTPAGTSEGTNTGFHPSSPPPASRSFFEEHDREREEIRFNQSTEYAPLLNHSPYSVSYERVRYPTATHLLEAMKFLPESDHNHGIAELIRTCEDTADVYHLSQEHVDAQNQNETGEMYLERMEKVMHMKFSQHSELRELLLSTGDAHLVYNDPSDSFWGNGTHADGQPGQNELGQIMMRVRGLLQQE